MYTGILFKRIATNPFKKYDELLTESNQDVGVNDFTVNKTLWFINKIVLFSDS